jgi:serine protease AprX
MATTLRLQRPLRLWAVTCVVLALAAVGTPVAAATSRWIVPNTAVLPTGALVVGTLPLADAVIVTSPSAPAGGVAYDTPLGTKSLPSSPDADGLRIDSGVATTAAPAVWAGDEHGERAVVALIDTGVAPVDALDGAVVGEIDFSGTGGGDPYGHGTFLASLIAGQGPDAPGVAPGTGILSLKVGGPDGSTTLGAVLSALQWLHGPGRAAGLRIATLALGVDASTDAAELLDRAADRLGRSGMLLVTAAGNDGPGHLSSPATARNTFSVGSVDDHATADRSDDTVSDFSATGPDRAGVAQPDIAASGEMIVAAMPEGSAIAELNPGAWIEPGLFRGSGTSMATALVAGVAALASSARPDLDGDALADALREGGSIADAPAVVAAAQAAPAGRPHQAPPGLAEQVDGPGNGRDHNDNAAQAEPNGIRWTGIRWTGIRWTGIRWTGIRWTGIRWTGIRWTGEGWGDENWVPGTWGGIRWTGSRWSSLDTPEEQGIRWTGIRWTGIRWTGIRWTGIRWTGIRWTGIRWTGIRWTGIRWTMLEAPLK